jgi:hypothetical protein
MYKKYIFIKISLQKNYSSRNTIPLSVRGKFRIYFYFHLKLTAHRWGGGGGGWVHAWSDIIVSLAK